MQKARFAGFLHLQTRIVALRHPCGKSIFPLTGSLNCENPQSMFIH
jgi:hypothetical protein